MVDQSDALGIDPGPHPALRNLVHFLHRFLPAVADPAQEFRIGMIDRILQDLASRRGQRPVLAHVAGERGGAEPIDLDPEFLERVLKGRDDGKHADGSRQCRRAGEYLIGRRGNIITAGRGIAAHRDHDGFAGLAQALHLTQDLLRGEHAAARAVDPQHHGLHGPVVARLPQQVGSALAADRARRLMTVENLT